MNALTKMNRGTIEELKRLVVGRRVGFTASAFDLPHAGHCYMLEESKRHLESKCKRYEKPFLLVLLQSDPSVDRPSKNKPIQSLEERYVQISANRHVDYVMIYNTEHDLLGLLKRLVGVAEVRFIGADWKDAEYTGKGLPFEIFWNDRSHGYSTSGLRARVWEAEDSRRAAPDISKISSSAGRARLSA